MSGPQRELPPLRVIVTGDSSGAVKAMQEVADAAKAADKTIKASGKKTTKAQKEQLDQRQQDVLDFYKNTAKLVSKADKDAYKLMPFAKKAQSEVTKFRAKAKKDMEGLSKDMEKEFRQQGKLLPAFARIAKKGASRGSDLNTLVENAKKEQAVTLKISKQKRDENMRRNKQLDKAAKADIAADDKRNAEKQKAAEQDVLKFYKGVGQKAAQAEKEFREQGKLLSPFARIAKQGITRGPDLNALVDTAQKEQAKVVKINKARRDENLRRNKQLDIAAKREVAAENKQAEALGKAMVDERQLMFKADQARAKQVEESRKAIAKQSEQAVKERENSLKLANMNLSNLLADGMKIQREHQQAADREHSLQRKADQERAKQVEESRKAIAKQSEMAVKERKNDIETELRIQRQAGEQLAAEVARSRSAIAKQTEALTKEDERVSDRARARKRSRLKRERAEVVQDSNAFLAHQKHVQDTIAKIREMRAKSDQADVEAAKKNNAAVQKSRDAYKADYDKHLDDIRKNNEKQDKADRAAASKSLAKQKSDIIKKYGSLTQAEYAAQSRMHASLVQARNRLNAAESRGNNMMGARADVYMHQDFLGGLVQSSANFLAPFAQVENASIQMKVFAGSAEEAKAATEELQKFAVESPYKLTGVLNAATTMMLYGQSTEQAIKNTKLLGNVAAGNSHKLELLSLAMGQASALGRLQGQELRQMVNAGFNPLTIAAEEMAGPGADAKAIQAQMDILQTAMRAGKLDSNIVDAALAVATAKGGKYAGLSGDLAGGLQGLASQVLETVDLIKVAISETFAQELKDAIKTIKNYADALVGWIKANKETVKWAAMLAIKVLALMVAFHALGFAIAWLKWTTGTLRTVFIALAFGGLKLFEVLLLMRTGIVAIIGATRMFGVIAMASGIKAAIGWAVASAPLWAIPALIAAIAVGLAGLAHEDGFAGLFKDGMNAGALFIGFFWNIGHNLKNIFQYIGANWQVLLFDMIFMMNPFMTAIVDMIAMILKPFGMDKEFRGMIEGARESVVTAMGGSTTYDTSMLKLDGPSLGGLTGGIDGMLGISDALKPYMPKDEIQTPHDKPDVNFGDFIRGGSPSEIANMKMAPDHAVRGSSDHAVRMYEYGEKARASQMTGKETHEKKTETLLTKIEQNTRPKAPTMNGGTLEEAGLNMAGML